MSLVAAVTARPGPVEVRVDLAVEAGETLAVLGPNGAGKTTLLRALAGLEPLLDGRIELDDRVLADAASGVDLAPEARSVGIVFQELLLFDHLDVRANVAFGARAAGRSPRDAGREADRWLDALGLAPLAGARPRTLSGGEAQRVALARALVPRPRLLLLDEPLAALDAEVRGDVRRTLRDHLRAHHDGPTILVTHDPLDAAVLADRAAILEEGRITAVGLLRDLVARPRTRWGAELAGTNLLQGIARAGVVELPSGASVAVAGSALGGATLVSVRPSAVALHLVRPEGSPRNVWPATVTGVEGIDERLRVQLDGPVPLVAEVTPAAVRDLAIRPGAELWASVKATEVEAYPG